MKIAVPTSDKINIANQTGRAPLFAVATVEESNITHIEYRESSGHHHPAGGEHVHRDLVELIADCELVLVKNIGNQMIDDFDAAGFQYSKVAIDKIGDAIHYVLSG